MKKILKTWIMLVLVLILLVGCTQKEQSKGDVELLSNQIQSAVKEINVIDRITANDANAISSPDVVGEEYNDVIDDEKYKDVTFLVMEQVYSDEFEAGEIVSQSPKAGSAIKKGSTIVLTISLGSKMTSTQN